MTVEQYVRNLVREINREIKRIDGGLAQFSRAFNQLNREHADLKGRVEMSDHWQRYERLLAGQYEKARTYSNLILAVGYAGFFGLWSISRDYTPPKNGI